MSVCLVAAQAHKSRQPSSYTYTVIVHHIRCVVEGDEQNGADKLEKQ
jgi:hypothetical protein